MISVAAREQAVRAQQQKYSASKNWSSVLNVLIVLAIPHEPERVGTCN